MQVHIRNVQFVCFENMIYLEMEQYCGQADVLSSKFMGQFVSLLQVLYPSVLGITLAVILNIFMDVVKYI